MLSAHSFVGRMCAGFILATAACPVTGPAQTIDNPAPVQTPGSTEPEAAEPPPSPATTPAQPGTPFGAAPGTFPGLAPSPSSVSPSQPTSPFGPAPGTFPGVSPAPATAAPAQPFGSPPGTLPGVSPAPSSATPAQPLNPFGTEPGTFPGLSPPTQPGAPSGPAAGITPGSAPLPTANPTLPTNPFPDNSLVPSAFAPPQLTPGLGYGVPAAPIPGGAPLTPVAPPAPPNYAGLAPMAPGALPVQAGNLRAPPILINSTVYLSEAYTDNPLGTPQTFSDVLTRISPGTNISFDTSRFQGQLASSINYSKFARTSNEDSLNGNLLGFGLGTIVRDHLFIDTRAAITQVSTIGGLGFVNSPIAGLGFANTPLISTSPQTQSEVMSLSPIWRIIWRSN